MSSVRCDTRLTAALVRLHDIAHALLSDWLGRDRGGDHNDEELQHGNVFMRITCCLVTARECAYIPEAFINELVALCRWPTSQPTSWDKFLQILSVPSPPVIFQTRWLDQEAGKHAQESFSTYAASPLAIQERLTYFRSSNPTRLIEVSASQVSSQSREPPEDFPGFVADNLYMTLLEYSNCNCSVAPSPQDGKRPRHQGRLCLTGRPSLEANLAIYDLHFLSSPSTSLVKVPGSWRQFGLRISRKRSGLKSARVQAADAVSHDVATDKPTSGEDLPTDSTTFVEKEKFCELLRDDELREIQTPLQVTGQYLYRSVREVKPEQQLLPMMSISLAEVLVSYKLSSKMQFALAYTLALSVWRFYDSRWMTGSWSTHSIHFMFEYQKLNRDQPLVTCRPCFNIEFENVRDANPEKCNKRYISHFPRLLSLGTVLLQIGWGDRIHDLCEVERSGHGSARTLKMLNDEWIWGSNFGKDAGWPRIGLNDSGTANLRGSFRDATMACFEKELFTPDCNSCNLFKGSNESTDPCSICIESRRKTLLKKVVLPLRDALYDSKWEDILSDPDVIPPRSENTDKFSIRAQLATQSASSRQLDQLKRIPLAVRQTEASLPTRFHHDVSSDLSIEDFDKKRIQYMNWKLSLKRAILPFQEEKIKSRRRVKIAVFDTGLDMTHPRIEPELARIWVYNDRPAVVADLFETEISSADGNSTRDKLGSTEQPDQAAGQRKEGLQEDNKQGEFKRADQTTIDDKEGHGTHIASLVLEYALDAYLYVANVSDHGTADRKLLARAIRTAVDDKVDIISISIGFEDREYPDVLEEAIEYAKGAHVHIFASASNNGGNGIRTWPAKFDNVFCIHSTDSQGNESKFNPSELTDHDFSTIGEAVISSWPHSLSEDAADEGVSLMAKFGTSFSTPIAACIAAFLLRYARTNLEKVHADRLKYHGVMRTVLKALARNERRHGLYYYLTVRCEPGHLFYPKESIKQRLTDIIKNS